VGVGGVIRKPYLLYSRKLGRGVGRSLGVFAGDQHMHLATEFGGGGQRLVGGVLDRCIVVFGDQQRGH
jgi:hypothetical protein